MSYALASRLLRAVKASGLPYTEVSGWRSRGRGTMRTIHTITCHHTATPRSLRPSSDYPTMTVVRDGRPGLPGPLAQIGLGRSGHVYLIAAGIANHAGKSRRASYTNPHAIGIEAEGAMEEWPRRQYQAYARLCRALSDEFGAQVLGHKETADPPGRKVDPSFSMSAFRTAVKAATAPKPELKPAPTPKGILGMTTHESRRRGGDQTVKAGAKARIRLHRASKSHAGPHYIARVSRKGQKHALHAGVSLRRLPAGADVKAQIVVVQFPRSGGVEVSRPFEQVSFPAGGSGWSSVEVSELTSARWYPSANVKAVEYHLEISNYSKQPVTVASVTSSAFSD